MAPRTLYARRDLLNGDEFVAWFKAEGFKTCLLPNKIHCTIIYSKTAFSWGGPGELKPKQRLLTCRGTMRSIDRLGVEGAVVLRFESLKLQRRCQQIKDAGGKSDYPRFKPHLTITYNAPPDLDIKKVKPFTKPLLFGPEIFKEIDPKFTTGDVAEKSRPIHV